MHDFFMPTSMRQMQIVFLFMFGRYQPHITKSLSIAALQVFNFKNTLEHQRLGQEMSLLFTSLTKKLEVIRVEMEKNVS